MDSELKPAAYYCLQGSETIYAWYMDGTVKAVESCLQCQHINGRGKEGSLCHRGIPMEFSGLPLPIRCADFVFRTQKNRTVSGH